MASSPATQGLRESHSFIGGSVPRSVTGNDQGALQRVWRVKGGETEPEVLSDKADPTQAWGRAGAKPDTSPVRAAHTEFVAILAGYHRHGTYWFAYREPRSFVRPRLFDFRSGG